MHRLMSFLMAGLLLISLAISAVAETQMLDVSVAYRERIALPPDAVVDVELLDTSRMDVAAERLSSQRFKMTAVPFSVSLAYDPELIDERRIYTVTARILSDGRVMFRTTQAYPVLTRGAGTTVDLTLQMMPASLEGTPAPASIDGVVCEAFEIGGLMLVVDTPPTLQIDANGRFGLFSGCNTFTGQAEVGADTITFPENFAGTLMACPPGPDQLQRQVLEAIGASVGYTLNESGLVFTNAAGLATLRFQSVAESP